MTQAPLREQMTALEHLQELDLKIDNLKKNKGALPAALKILDDSLARAKGAVDAKKKAIEEIEKVQRQTHAALDLNKDRQARSTARLEGVQNTQEYSAVTKEIEQLHKLNLSLEDQLKKSTAEIDGIKKELTTLESQVVKAQAERDERAATVSGQNTQFDTEIDQLLAERKGYTSKIEPRLVSQYDRVRGARGGLGLVPAVGGRCKGCNMVVPPQLYNMIQKALEVHACPSCHRILYIPAAGQTPEAST